MHKLINYCLKLMNLIMAYLLHNWFATVRLSSMTSWLAELRCSCPECTNMEPDARHKPSVSRSWAYVERTLTFFIAYFILSVERMQLHISGQWDLFLLLICVHFTQVLFYKLTILKEFGRTIPLLNEIILGFLVLVVIVNSALVAEGLTIDYYCNYAMNHLN